MSIVLYRLTSSALKKTWNFCKNCLQRKYARTIKSYCWGLKCRRLEPTVKVHDENTEWPDKCHVKLFEKYLLLRALNSDLSFYLKPLNKLSPAGWGYSATAVIGANTLKSMLKRKFTEVGLKPKTNHSLKDSRMDEQRNRS